MTTTDQPAPETVLSIDYGPTWVAALYGQDGFLIPDDDIRGWAEAAAEGKDYVYNDQVPDELWIATGAARPEPQSPGSEFYRRPGWWRAGDVFARIEDLDELEPAEVVAQWERAQHAVAGLNAGHAHSMEHMLAGARKGAASFLAKHGGDVVISVTLGNRLWQAGIRSIALADGTVVPIDDEGEGVTFMDVKGEEPDRPMTDALLHYHRPVRDDAVNDWDDDWDDDDDA